MEMERNKLLRTTEKALASVASIGLVLEFQCNFNYQHLTKIKLINFGLVLFYFEI
jgi:hypothetical protein